MKEIAVLAMRRSGHHAVINWLSKHVPGAVLMTEERGQDLTRPVWRDVELDADKATADVRVGDFEEIPVEQMRREYHEPIPFGEAVALEIVVVRDPFNLFASRVRMLGERRAFIDGAVDIWKDHARRLFDDGPVVAVNFNKWFAYPQYRHMLLHGPLQDHVQEIDPAVERAARQQVLDYGRGSSFDELEYDGRATQMRVLHRFQDEPNFDPDVHFDQETFDLCSVHWSECLLPFVMGKATQRMNAFADALRHIDEKTIPPYEPESS